MAPPAETLRQLYETERLTTRQIGRRLGVSKTTVRRWMQRYGIESRAPRNGLENRGIVAPTADELRGFVADFMSLDEIAARYGVDRTAVWLWLRKHGIPRNSVWDTRKNGGHHLPTEGQLRRLYPRLSIEQIADRFGLSHNPVRRLLREFGIEVRRDGWNGGRRFLCDDGHEARSTYERVVDNWLHGHGIPHEVEPRLPCDRRYRADFLANGWFVEVWGVNNNVAYRQRKKRKQAMYAANGYPLIELSYSHFSTKYRHLVDRRLSACLRHAALRDPACLIALRSA